MMKISSETPISGGGNNRIYRMEYADGSVVAKKSYLSSASANLQRLEKEFSGLAFLTALGEQRVPKPIAIDREAAIGLYQWIDGRPVEAISSNYIEQVIAFVGRLQGYAKHETAKTLPLATDAVLGGQMLLAQIDRRIKRLQEQGESAQLADFLKEALIPLYIRISEQAKQFYKQEALDFETTLSEKWQIPSPSDFGMHNVLVDANERLFFIDFEYFGWDDPVTLISHFLWHPGVPLNEAHKQQVVSGVTHFFSADRHFRFRLAALFPLFGLVWALIVLNEFLPEMWTRRVFAGKVTEAERTRIQDRQLQTAMLYLRHVATAAQQFPYV